MKHRSRTSLPAATVLVAAQVADFDRYATQAEALFAQDRAGEGEAAALRAFELYGVGRRRDGEDDAWQLVERSRLAAKYTRLVSLTGQHWMRAGKPEAARRAYERALELEPLAEEIYRSLMLVLVGLGQPAEALRVYRRCRDMLSVVLGVKPTAETERVHEALRGG